MALCDLLDRQPAEIFRQQAEKQLMELERDGDALLEQATTV
jgi:hypothetical protein